MAIIIIAFLFFWQAPQGPGRMEGIGADSGYGNGPVTGALPVIPPGREGEGDQGDDEPGILFGTEDERAGRRRPANSLRRRESDQESEDAGDEGYELADPVEYAIVRMPHTAFIMAKEDRKSRGSTHRNQDGNILSSRPQPHRLSWEEPGVYLFDAGGKFSLFSPSAMEIFRAGSPFPERKICGRGRKQVVGDWHIFTFPDLQKMGTIRAYESIVWEDDDYIIYGTSSYRKTQLPANLSVTVYRRL